MSSDVTARRTLLDRLSRLEEWVYDRGQMTPVEGCETLLSSHDHLSREHSAAAQVSTPAGIVLVAEDDPINAELLQDLLDSEGWAVDLAEDGEVALTKIAGGHYDLLLLDLHMPKIDGVDVLRRLQEGGCDRPGRIVVVTADLLYGIREDLTSLGADALLSKPVDVGALFRIIAEA